VGDWLRLYGPPALAWALVLGRLVGPYRFDTFERRAILICLTGVACTVTTTSPLGYLSLGELTGIPNVARPLGHFSMLMVVSATWALMLSLSNPDGQWRKSPWRTWWLLATVAAMTVAFALADTPENNVRFASDYGDTPWVMEYWLIYLSYLLPVYGVLFRLTRRYAQLSGRRSLRVGLHVITVGIVISAIYHVHKAFYFAALRFHWDYPAWLREPVDKYATVISMVLVLGGLTLPSWTWRVVTWLRQYRTYHRLGPLWRSLHAATPEIALSTAGFIESHLPRDLGLRLYRRVIEIRDGRLALTTYLDSEVAVRARDAAATAGLTGQRAEAYVEAVTLAEALRAKRDGRTSATPSTEIRGGDDLTEDTEFLTEVANAFRTVRAGDPARSISSV
jgi:hypothetical protein